MKQETKNKSTNKMANAMEIFDKIELDNERYWNSVMTTEDGGVEIDFDTHDYLINCPPHYVSGRKIEPIDVIEDWGLDKDYYLASVIKYISRYNRKEAVGNPLTCLKKAAFYLNRRIRNEEGP